VFLMGAMQLLRALLYIGVNRNLWSFRFSSGPGKAPLVRMHRFIFAIIIESALSPIQKKKSWWRTLGKSKFTHQPGRPSTKIAFLARTQPSSLDCWTGPGPSTDGAGRGVPFSCSLQMRTYVSWAGSSDRETIFRRFYRSH
jgi:hypothetical protein